MSIPASITDLIASSGNTFHSKVARWFRENGWHVVVSPYYMDQTQTKAREIDLVVEKVTPTQGSFRQPDGGRIITRLYIECKFIASESVFWFANKDMQAARDVVCKWRPFLPRNAYTEKHHYLSSSPKVAKLFASARGSDRSQENEPIYKALNQALNAMVALKHQAPTHPELKGRDGGVRYVFDYPIIVCSSFNGVYGVDFLETTAPTRIDENFQLEVQYAYLDRNGGSVNDHFLVDMVSFDGLGSIQAAIEADVGAALVLHAN